MTDIKLPRLPDRTPVKLAIAVGSELHQSLKAYAALYQATYGVSEQIVDLIPFMLDAFLQSDKAFAKVPKKIKPF
jgi:hypothetical protein